MSEELVRHRLTQRHAGYQPEVNELLVDMLYHIVICHRYFKDKYFTMYAHICTISVPLIHCQGIGPKLYSPVEEEEERVASIEVTESMSREEVCSRILDTWDTLHTQP